MCLGGPDIPAAEAPIDRGAESAQKAAGRARKRRAAAFDESDTDVVGSLVQGGRVGQVNTQLKRLIGG